MQPGEFGLQVRLPHCYLLEPARLTPAFRTKR
jgi:hypothetical protein